MAGRLLPAPKPAAARCVPAMRCYALVVLTVLCPIWGLVAASSARAGTGATNAETTTDTAADARTDGAPPAADAADIEAGGAAALDLEPFHPPSYGPPGETPGLPSDDELEASGAVVGKIEIDNQNIFNLNDPADDNKFFRLADRLHQRTHPSVIRKQLLFRTGEPYSRRLLNESERILRANSYFYDAWIRPVAYHDGQVDVSVTTRDVWTLNPGFNISRSGGSNSTGVQVEDLNVLGSGIDVKLAHTNTIDRTTKQILVTNPHAFDGFTSVTLNYADLSDGRQRDFAILQPFYALDSRHTAGVSGIDDLQTDSLWDRGAIIDQFQDLHQAVQVQLGWSQGLKDSWVHRWTTGVTYDEHNFSPVSTWTGVTDIPPDRKFLYPWVQFDLLQDDYVRIWNHNQIARTEDFYVGTSVSVRAGLADSSAGSTQSALLFQSSASRGIGISERSILLFFGDFSGRVTNGELMNGVLDATVRYYREQSERWLFYTNLSATQAWRLDLDNQILLGGDNGLRGYPLRYQDGTGRALWTIEQRYFTDWYLFRLARVGAAVFFDMGTVWGSAPLAAPNYAWLKDAGFGLRLGNSRSGLGNIVHIDVAFPFNGDPSIKKVQFLIQTQQSF